MGGFCKWKGREMEFSIQEECWYWWIVALYCIYPLLSLQNRILMVDACGDRRDTWKGRRWWSHGCRRQCKERFLQNRIVDKNLYQHWSLESYWVNVPYIWHKVNNIAANASRKFLNSLIQKKLSLMLILILKEQEVLLVQRQKCRSKSSKDLCIWVFPQFYFF